MKRLVVLAGLAAAILLGFASAASAGVNDFRFASFDGQYSLGRDSGGRSVLSVVETLVAVFPQTDQNHGIRRELVDSFDGHPTGLAVASVTDESGRPRLHDGGQRRLPRRGDPGRRIRARIADLRDPLHAAQRHPVLRRYECRRVLLGHQRHRLGPALRQGHGDRAPRSRRPCTSRRRSPRGSPAGRTRHPAPREPPGRRPWSGPPTASPSAR